ncbi:hypothetical protein ASA1KI_29440 [Opitutales bacterium ASA1]|uniref:hypothetical protein n=1 Tax=Congregicoccus parvus TaxID=3081749 RepID=UPI002B31310D|nr:hypothetical protein ASA1KI_29440 [Opitutales bacterium ASA1]
MSEILGPSLMQLVAQAPVLLVYLVGIVLAEVLRARAPLASTLALVGSGLLLVISMLQPFVFQYVLRSRLDAGSSSDEITRVLGFFGVIAGFAHAAGLGLLVAAVFAQRCPASQRPDSLRV